MSDLIQEFMRAATLPAEEAQALPLQVYSDEAFYQQEVEKIFHADWVFACNSFSVKNPGDKFALTIAGEPVVIVRGSDGVLRALSNVCTHRGTPIADEGFSNAPNMVCPYHSWNFTLEGELKGAPYTGNIAVDKSAHCLPQYKLEEWYGLVFVNVDGTAPPLRERYAGMEPYMALYNQENHQYGVEWETEVWESNWKLVMENAMESYHLFKVHKPTLETITPTKGAYYVEGNAEWTLTAGEYVGFMDPLRKLTGKKRGPADNYLLISLPPSFVGILSVEGTNGYLSMLPDGPGRCFARGGSVGVKPYKPSKVEAQFTRDFFDEDKWICERAFKSMRSRHAKGGQFVELERIVQDFHRYLACRIGGVEVGDTYRNPDIDQRLLEAS